MSDSTHQNNDAKPFVYKPSANLAEIRAKLRAEDDQLDKDIKNPNSETYKDLKKWCQQAGAPYEERNTQG